ncbi:uncharacterized protein DNG_04129 [Cephalotrichum gorgonifer]|uniref:L-ascorbic acid binding protein n=1 Tax=Cephalotrichum gorgonifer TaxID=2041049 RepID=A0AAE8SUW6_9PEZI|nr:uncharacterized protein DNG_04129 [Cephalotrichum gorgonifer]
MATPDEPISRFKKSMQDVYGPIDDLTAEKAKTWDPPSSPGAGGHRGRYLWTDAFGVVNLITLYKETSDPSCLELAKSLVRTVHDVLGRTRDGTARLPGATDSAPLKGGLRIGKLDEGGRDGDGQYHHYLTLWMFALNRLSVAAGDRGYNDLAVQLAAAIHPHFVHRSSSGRLSLVWKISMDMRLALVPSEGHLDGATGYVIYGLLQRTAAHFDSSSPRVLEAELKDYSEIMGREGGRGLTASTDSLDLGMGLWMCHLARGEPWADRLGAESMYMALKALGRDRGPPSRRLAFREFGLCLGARCYGAEGLVAQGVDELVRFWEEYEDELDGDLRPISLVMYAAAIMPGAFRKEYLPLTK